MFGLSRLGDGPSIWKAFGVLFLFILVHVVRLNLILVSFIYLQLNRALESSLVAEDRTKSILERS